jgi:hypothetical protein
MGAMVEHGIATARAENFAGPVTGIADLPIGAQPPRPVGRPAVQHVCLLVDPSQVRQAHRALATRLRQAGLRVCILPGRAPVPLPSPVALLLRMERVIHRVIGSRLSDPLDFRQLSLPQFSSAEPPDLIVDLCGDSGAGQRSPTVRIVYDGVPGETALIGALVAGRMPMIEIEDPSTGMIVAGGLPCADNAPTLSDMLEHVLARTITLILSLARDAAPASPRPRPSPRRIRSRDIAAREAKLLSHAIIHRLYELCCYTPHWRTCWRFVDGPDVWDTQSLGSSWSILPDPGFRFYADPFPFVHEGRTYVFVEDLDHRTNKAAISVLPFDDRGPSGPAEPVLDLPWHLSYPFVFEHDGQIWMIPESSANRTVTLYRADPFPYRWVVEEILLADIQAGDATVTWHAGSFWMFTATRDEAGSWSDTLSIFTAPRLQGPWRPHAANPVLIDQTAARPAGAMVWRHGTLWRPVQDCSAGYGTGVGLAEVTRLDHGGFSQKVHTVLRPDSSWPGRRLHTLNRAGRLECIDGSAYSPRNRWLASRLQARSGRRDMSGPMQGVEYRATSPACPERSSS